MTMLSGPTFSAVLLFERHQPQWADIVNILLLLQFTNSLIVLVLVLLVIKKRKPKHNVVRTDVVNQISLLVLFSLLIIRKLNHNVVRTDVINQLSLLLI